MTMNITNDTQNTTQNTIDNKKLKFKRLRRVTGYLTGDYQTRFNDSKQAEVKDRVKHSCTTM